MRPTKLSSMVFLELPPVLAHYLEGDRNQYIEGSPRRGTLNLLERQGVFADIESLAVERRQLMSILGLERTRALRYRTGFEQGRRDGARHFASFDQNARLALQAGPVFGQVQGRFVAEPIRFEFDLSERTLYREIALRGSVEAMVHRMVDDNPGQCVCWTVAGYLSGHVSEILGRRVVTMETECQAKGDSVCRFISRLDAEWGKEADWTRDALAMASIDMELAEREEKTAQAQQATRKTQAALNDVNKRLRSELMLESLVADADIMQPVMGRARQAMASDVPVMLVGETGVGKELMARAIHAGSSRKNKSFVPVDCVGLPEPLLKQELIGFAKGAFPGAVRAHAGAYARANGGTLYLNEITKLSAETQGLLLQCLSDGAILPLGAEKAAPADVRVIAATQFDPLEKVKSGELREDLYYALTVLRADIPPLRDRETDILRLAESFLAEFRERYDRPQTIMSAEFSEALLDCAWPGNISQLKNVIEHAMLVSAGPQLEASALPEDVLAVRKTQEQGHDLSENVLRAVLARTRNNRTHAAKLLGIGRTTLWRAMKRVGLE